MMANCDQILKTLLLLFIAHQRADAFNRSNNLTLARIVGGTTTTIGQHPHLVQLYVSGHFMCGGALVTPLHVVSAAHCVIGVPFNQMAVIAGTTYLTQGGIRSTVASAVVPRSYNVGTRTMDVSVLKLNQPMLGGGIKTIPLCNTRFRVNELVVIAGWGKTTENAEKPSSVLRTVQLPLISLRTCSQAYGPKSLTATMFCAQGTGKDSCQGDSGGPVVYRRQLCGIVSWGMGCARPNYPGVYTSINAVKKFILKNIRT